MVVFILYHLFVCLFICMLFFLLLPLLLILVLLLFCWRFVVIALLSVLHLDYKIGHRKSFWYSPFLIQFFAHDYNSITDEMYSLRSRSIGIKSFGWLGWGKTVLRWLINFFKWPQTRLKQSKKHLCDYIAIIWVISSQTGEAAWQPKTVGKVFYWETLTSSTRLIPLEHDRSLR